MRRAKLIELAISSEDHSVLTGALITPDNHENFAVLLCGRADTDTVRKYLVRFVWPAPGAAYEERLPYHLAIAPAFFNEVVSRALSERLHPVIIHSHPGALTASYSPSDDHGESRLLPVLTELLPGLDVASALFTTNEIVARRLTARGFEYFDSVLVRGRTSVSYRRKRELTFDAEPWERQIRAIGSVGQSALRGLTVGIVGLGGTGSLVVEQLARMGIQAFVLIDDDRFEESNLSRLYGSTLSDVKTRPLKTKIAARSIRGINDGASIREIPRSAKNESVLRELRNADLIFCCTDNHFSRALLNRFAYQYLIPVVDVGTRLDARTGMVAAASGRISVVGPGATCLRCSRHIDPDQIRAETIPRNERDALVREGYIQGSEERAPAVASINGTVASLGVTAGLAMFANLVGAPPPAGQIYDATSGCVFPVTPVHDELCDVCSPTVGAKGLGDARAVSPYDD